jgi:tol-pal system protein YbgF
VIVGGGAALLLLLAASGCAPQLDRIELGQQEIRDELAELSATNRRLERELSALNELVRQGSDLGGETDAQRTARLGQLSQRIDQLMQLLQDNSQYMRDLSARVDLLATRSGVPTLGEYKPPPAGAAAGLPEEGRSIFQAAELDRDRGNRELAAAGYGEFLEKYPESELADDALYWLGVLEQEADHCEQALSHFGLLLSRFPQSERAASALLKSALCLDELGERDEAEKKRQELLQKFPESDEANLVRAGGEGR